MVAIFKSSPHKLFANEAQFESLIFSKVATTLTMFRWDKGALGSFEPQLGPGPEVKIVDMGNPLTSNSKYW